MASIPMGNFGFRTPQETGPSPTPRLDTQVGDAAQRLGAQLTAAGGQELHSLRAEDERRAREAQNMQVMLAHAGAQNDLNDAFRQVETNVLDGKVDKVEALSTWRDQQSKILEARLQGVPADRADLIREQMNGLRGRLEESLFATFRKRDQQEVAAGMVAMNEQLQRFALTDPASAVKQWNAAVETQAQAAGWTPEHAQRQKATFVENVTFNQFRRAGQQAMQSGSTEAIEEVQKRLAGPEGDALDPAKRNTLDQTLFGWKQSIDARRDRDAAKAEREWERREKKAQAQVDKADELAMAGHFMSPDFIADTSSMVQGTGLERQWQETLQSQQSISSFASRPPQERAALLNGARARAADPMVGTDPKTAKRLARAERIDETLRRKVADGDAWEAAQSVGVIRTAPQINIADPQGAIQAVGQRMADIDVVEDWAGQKVSPFQPAEAVQLAKIMKTLKPDQAASLLGQIGARVGDADRVAALARQVDKDDDTLSMAMLYANAKTTEGRYTAQLVLEGAQKVKDKAVRVDGAMESGWRGTIAKTIRGAYSNQDVENRMVQAAFLIAAAKDGDIDNAINLATGGIIERNGAKIPLPYGMKEREFSKRIEGVTVDTLVPQVPGGVVMAGPARVPLADFVRDLPKAKLVHAGQGVYNVQAGNTLVTDERGRRIAIQVTP
ncbi:hypothetical protein [uncultured Pseudacidovorax sp.]|uniref:hypothetical protein n=1 Tax=uncultured Pseudacidovorax sp. TaxID=679313 RepID=UPI002600D1C2|nr:hypothetical protein [uncultured Pseudacidovorax sp.]